ncbi:rhomboid family intramembrane serine protease [Arachidicoccus ginsenosidimutans]|uniref:rhomboid family intramembrane serine protease n=1 Tax=Arachidicoccus sp. BS20 TaxID=1850526 RepID=UPI0007F17F23|nr:rhomboid family intramembrane serine protease [Arachidicoccus sp. BS20]ANI87915.1 rhomboid family intramembrane serine protease [Arachidicoccus sp. BS20]
MITLFIIIATCIVSFMAFSNGSIIDKLIFYPPAVSQERQWYRFFSCGLIHADFGHLIFNMYAFYSFGNFVEDTFGDMFGEPTGTILYLILYISALAVCLLPTYFQNRNNYAYRSLGASGAVSAIVFASIILNPTAGIGLIFIPGLSIPAFIFGIIYLAVSYWLDKRGGGNINHSAHLYGGLYGIIFLIIAGKIFSQYDVIAGFIFQVRSYLRM